ncbi:hypothetical protein ACF0H5_002796 [Mactra antiquata]
MNVYISSTIAVITIVSYGSQNWNNSENDSWQSELHQTPSQTEEIDQLDQTMTHLCYTNDPQVYTRLRRCPIVFVANLTTNDFVYLLLDSTFLKAFNINISDITHRDKACDTYRSSDYSYHCCSYSPNSSKKERQDRNNNSTFSYYRKVIQDNFIRIEDILLGKQLFVDQYVHFGISNGDVNITIAAHHQCRSDVIVDPYPEVHITTDHVVPDHGLIRKSFHWYL